MLNTDLHNRNIRADRKMTVDSFIKNNKNYGPEVTTLPMPDSFLTMIFGSILGEEIITKADGPEGDMTVDRWKDAVRTAQSRGSHATEYLSTSTFGGEKGADAAAVDSGGSFARIVNRQVLSVAWRPVLAAGLSVLDSPDSTCASERAYS